MIRIQQIKLPVSHTRAELHRKAAKLLKLSEEEIKKLHIVRRSLDARKKPELFYVYTIDAELASKSREKQVLKKVYRKDIMLTEETEYRLPAPGSKKLEHPPVIVGSGPAGLFCAYALAKRGFGPIIIERGKEIRARRQDVEQFWQGGPLRTESNVQFGEGGAGTFSDGKLNTLIKDKKGRSREVLNTFVTFGAPEEILYDAKPHIGTDVLTDVIEAMRKAIQAAGGTFLFETCLEGFTWEQGRLAGIICRQGEKRLPLETEALVLAIGHSARDTFSLLAQEGFYLEPKAFAVGLRIEHPQDWLDELQYGAALDSQPGHLGCPRNALIRQPLKSRERQVSCLPAASYKVTAKLQNQRGVYSFCMCPGGYVVNASSEPGRLSVNGMSYRKRDGANANSAVIVTVTPEDFQSMRITESSFDLSDGLQVPYKGEKDPLAGIAFQLSLEERAFQMGQGRIPQQLFGDFAAGQISSGYGAFESQTKGSPAFGPLHTLFPKELTDSLIQGIHAFSRQIPGFDRTDAILSGVESRTSSPVRIPRGEDFLSSRPGVYPCGEGAGYAGGILSAAMDGLKVAEAIIGTFYR